MTAEEDNPIVSDRVIWETAKSSRHLRIAVPGLLERIISPAILLAKTSLKPGETDMGVVLDSHPFKVTHLNPYYFSNLNNAEVNA